LIPENLPFLRTGKNPSHEHYIISYVPENLKHKICWLRYQNYENFRFTFRISRFDEPGFCLPDHLKTIHETNPNLHFYHDLCRAYHGCRRILQYTALSVTPSTQIQKVQLSLFQPVKPLRQTTDSHEKRLILESFCQKIPEAAVPNFLVLVKGVDLKLKMTRHRISKSGDFRPALGERPACITINESLNPYAFLITLLHEMAHFKTWSDYQQNNKLFSLRRHPRPQPHGTQWKKNFRLIMKSFLEPDIFPPEILEALSGYLVNPRASTASDHQLSRCLQQYDPVSKLIRLEDIPSEALFTLHGKRIFRKKEKIRTRYRCICMKTNRLYLVSRMAPVTPL